MQWLNKVDDALDWVLGPPPTPQEPNIDDSSNNNIEKKNNHNIAAANNTTPNARTARQRDNVPLPRKSPVIIHEDYTCPATPIAATAGEFLVLDDNHNHDESPNKLKQQQSLGRDQSLERSSSSSRGDDNRGGGRIINEESQARKVPPPPPAPASQKQQPQQLLQTTQVLAPPPPPPQLTNTNINNNSTSCAPSTPRRRIQSNNAYNNNHIRSATTPRGSAATPGVIRRRIRTPSISPPPSPNPPPPPPPPIIIQTIESSTGSGDENDLNRQPTVQLPSIDVSNDNIVPTNRDDDVAARIPTSDRLELPKATTSATSIATTPLQSQVQMAVSQLPPPPLSSPEFESEPNNEERHQPIMMSDAANQHNFRHNDNSEIIETRAAKTEKTVDMMESEQKEEDSNNIITADNTAEIGIEQKEESKIVETEAKGTEQRVDTWTLGGWFSSSSRQDGDATDAVTGQTNKEADTDDNQFQKEDEDDSVSSDSFHSSSNISRNSGLTNDDKEEAEEADADNESNFEKDYEDFAIPFPSSSTIQDDRDDWDSSFNCYGIVHVRLLRAQRLPCDEHSTIYATLSLPPWKGRIRIPSREAKRGPTGAGICSRWDKLLHKKKEDGGVAEEGDSPLPPSTEADDHSVYHMVHAYNNEDTPVPTVSLELSVAKLGGVFEKFLCSISLPCHGLMRSPGSWTRQWYPAITTFGADEVEEGVDLDTLPFILLETCFEPKIEDSAEATISEDDTLGSIPRDFEIRSSPQRRGLQHMPESIYSSVDDESTSLMSGITSRNVVSTKPHLLRVRSFWGPAWCAVCSKVITTGWMQGSFECEACHIYCCRDCQLQVDIRIPCGSELSTIAVKNAQKYQVSLGQIMTTLAPHQENGTKPVDGSASGDKTNLDAVRDNQEQAREMKGIGILNIRVIKACLFDKTYPSETEPSAIFEADSSNLRNGDHYVRVSWLGSRDSKRTKTVLQASKPVFDSDNMLFDVPHYAMEYKVEVVDANTDRPVGSCLLSAQGLLQWQRDELLSSIDRLLLSFFHFRHYSEPRRLRLELRTGVKDGFGLNFYNSAKLDGSNGTNSSLHAGEISGWIDLDLNMREDRQLFYSLEPRRCPPKADEEFDIALIQLHIARISALVEDIQKIVSVYMYLVGWENEQLTGAAMIFFVVFTLRFNLEYLGALPVGFIVLYMIYLAYIRITGQFKDRFISKEKDALIESEKKIEKNNSIYRPIGILEVGELRGKHLKTRELGLPGSFYATISYDPVRYADEHTKASLAKIDASSTCSHQIGSTISPGITSHPSWTTFQDSPELMRFRYSLPDHQSLGKYLSKDNDKNSLNIVYPVLQPLTEDDGIEPEEEADGRKRRDIQVMPWESSHGAIVIQVRFSDVLGSLFDNVLGEVAVPLAKLAGSRRAVEGWFRLLDVGTTDTVPGDSVDTTAEGLSREPSASHKGEEGKESPQIDFPEVYLNAKFSTSIGSSSSSDTESSKVICEELVRTASLSKENGVGVIGSSLSTLNTVRTLGGTLQNQICYFVDMIEKARNAFNFSNPRITVVILLCLSVLWMILALIPTRIVVLIGGLAQFGVTYYEKFISQRKKKKEVSSDEKKSDVADVGNPIENMFLSIPTDEDLRRTYFWEARRVGESERKKYATAKRQTRVEKLWKARWHGVLEMKEKKSDTSDVLTSSERSSWNWKGVFALIEGHRFIWWRSEKHFDTGESPLGQIFFAGHSGLAGLSPLDLRELTKEEIPSVISIFGRGQQEQQKITLLAPSLKAKDSLENAVLFASTDAKAD